jgi:multiple sugar transport system substrate-binding protein
VPFYYYPWAVFYRKSLFQQTRLHAVPKTLDEFKALCGRMKTDGLNRSPSPTRTAGRRWARFDTSTCGSTATDFHVRLMAGKESWTSSQVKQVFDTWRGLLPYHQPGANGRTWQEAAQSLVAKQSGMYLLGAFVGEQFTDADRADLDFFAFPEINSQYKQDAVEAPIDGFMVSKKAKNTAGAKDLMKYLATPDAELLFLKSSPNNVATHKDADTSGYTPLQKRCAELVGGAKQVSQFLDRDTGRTSRAR